MSLIGNPSLFEQNSLLPVTHIRFYGRSVLSATMNSTVIPTGLTSRALHEIAKRAGNPLTPVVSAIVAAVCCEHSIRCTSKGYRLLILYN